MSLVSLDFSLSGYPDIQVCDGQIVQGVIRDGKLHVTVAVRDETGVAENAARAFVRKWSGQGHLLPAEDLASDARLAALTAKHIPEP